MAKRGRPAESVRISLAILRRVIRGLTRMHELEDTLITALRTSEVSVIYGPVNLSLQLTNHFSVFWRISQKIGTEERLAEGWVPNRYGAFADDQGYYRWIAEVSTALPMDFNLPSLKPAQEMLIERAWEAFSSGDIL